jgi:Fe-S cluster biogenesis protein NfuA
MTESTRADDSFRQRMQRIEVLVRELNALPDPAARSGAVELLQAVLELHGAGLERVLATVQQAGPAGGAIVEQMLQDDLIGSLLLLHDLHPHDTETRVRRALDRLRPHLGVQGGRVELIGLDGGLARVRIEQAGHGTPAVAQEELVRQAILAAAPEVSEVLVEGAAGRGGSFIPLSSILKSPLSDEEAALHA